MFALSMSFLLSSLALIGPCIILVALLYARDASKLSVGLRIALFLLGLVATLAGIGSLLSSD